MARIRYRSGSFPLPFMRNGGIPLFTVLGIKVVAHYSWFIIVALIMWALTVGWFPSVLPDRSLVHYMLLGAITAFFFFASVFVHELMHSVVAGRNGIPVRRITLFLFGGVAEISKEPPDPRTELKIALAGPLTSAIIAAVCWTAVALMGRDAERFGLQLALLYLAIANTFLLGFNLLPGLPLDGGRVLRAIVWSVTRNLKRATYVASMVGKAIAGLMVLTGIVAFLWANDVRMGLWLIFIALFLRQAADTSYRQIVMREALGGMRIANVMTTSTVTVPPDITLASLIDSYLLRYHFTTYPVVSEGRPVGLITIRAVKGVPRESWEQTLVEDAMMPLTEQMSLSPEDDIPTTMQKMSTTGLGRLPVIDQDGLLVGIVSRRDVMAYVQIRSDLSSNKS